MSSTTEEIMEQAAEEIKRADHLIYVSLKYTRTVDVLKSIIERLINAFDHGFGALLQHAKNNKKISTVPELPRLKLDGIRTVYATDPTIMNYLDLYALFKKINKAQFKSSQEYRRHVTMTAHLDTDEEIEITIDIISDYFKQTKEFLNYTERLIHGTNE
ncbi:hypothetical protein HY485_02035 [Candidatus Woesearchaeota archaeon]|nr:hypothetical protein [Candidatus Woesearchaeota archaeon]